MVGGVLYLIQNLRNTPNYCKKSWAIVTSKPTAGEVHSPKDFSVFETVIAFINAGTMVWYIFAELGDTQNWLDNRNPIYCKKLHQQLVVWHIFAELGDTQGWLDNRISYLPCIEPTKRISYWVVDWRKLFYHFCPGSRFLILTTLLECKNSSQR